MTVRSYKVDALVEACFVGMEQLGGEYTGAELLAAVFTLTLRTVKATLVKNPDDLPYVKQACGILMLECVELDKKPN